VENKVMQVLQAVMENQVNVVMLENLALTVIVDSKDRQVQLANKVIEVNPVLYIPVKLVCQDSLVNVEIKVKKVTVVLLLNRKLFLLVLPEKKVNREKMVQLVIWVTKVNLVIAANLVNQAALENQTTKALLVKRVKLAKLD